MATDLDGTFLKNDKSVSEKNLEALHRLGEKKIVRVAATGRNLRKVKEVLNEHIPFDFVVYSSGAGIYNWNTGEHIYTCNLDRGSVAKLFRYFIAEDVNFHAFFPAPENHQHWYFRGTRNCDEFERYFGFNQAFASELNVAELPDTQLCQFLVIIPEDEILFQHLKTDIERQCSEIRVIRASSPISQGFIWMEVFHRSVSKGNGIRHICEMLGIKQEETVGVGNDYNDFDLLGFTRHSFLTENAPEKIRNVFPGIPSNENDAFAFVSQLIGH